MPATLESNLRETLAAISAASVRSGRGAGDVALVAVTKGVGPRTTVELARLGQRDLGENRLPNLVEKRAELERAGIEVRWHFIGHIQRNKARRILQSSEVLHSVDSLALIETLARLTEEEERRVGVYLEVKLSSEDSKHGLAPRDLDEAVKCVGAASRLDLVGLMTMAERPAAGDDPHAAAREIFDELARLAREIERNPELAKSFVGERVQLSMGMSGDFETAIASGSDAVRVGSALFRGISTDAPNTGGAA